MHHKRELQEVRQNLLNNLWHIVNSEPLEYIKFKEFLISLLISRGYKITTLDGFFLETYAQELKKEYAEVLSTIRSEVQDGDLIMLQKYVRNNINGKISKTLENFLDEYNKKLS